MWGTNTAQTSRDERLTNRFDYDGEYGTVLNRFLMQAACGIPLTVYGTGGQTRAFIHISDTCKCIELAVNNPPEAGAKVEILNQIAQTARVRDVANLVGEQMGAEVNFVANPRQEVRRAPRSPLRRHAAHDLRHPSFRHPSLTPLPPSLPPQDAENDLVVSNKKFKLLGLDPILLESAEGLFTEVKEIAQKYQHRCDRSKVVSKSYWNKARAVAAGAAAEEAAKTKV